MPDPLQYIQPLRDWLYVVLVTALPMLWLGYGLWWRGRGALLPAQRLRAAPWRGAEVVAVFVLTAFLHAFVVQLVVNFKLVPRVYGPETTDVDLRSALWAGALAFPMQAACTLLFLRLVSDTRPYQLGWTAHRLVPNVLLGYGYWLFLTPLVLAIFLLVIGISHLLLQVEPEPHPVTRLLQAAPQPIDWIMTLLTTVVAAPILEELHFRGVVQGWAIRRALGGDLVMAAALATALHLRWPGLYQAAMQHNPGQLLLELQPALFVLLLLPIYLMLRRRSQQHHLPYAPTQAVPAGIFAVAVFFALFHAKVWPTPIPLLVLGLGLGWLAHRTQSLVGPIVLHALFNAVAMIGLWHQDARPPEPPPKGNAVTWTAWREPPHSASSTVPGASLPRRR